MCPQGGAQAAPRNGLGKGGIWCRRARVLVGFPAPAAGGTSLGRAPSSPGSTPPSCYKDRCKAQLTGDPSFPREGGRQVTAGSALGRSGGFADPVFMALRRLRVYQFFLQEGERDPPGLWSVVRSL